MKVTHKSSFFARLSELKASLLAAASAALLVAAPASAQTLDPFYSSSYSVSDLGPVPGLPVNYGGITFKADDSETILIGGNANGSNAKIYAVSVVRGVGGHITGFTGSAAAFADANGLPTASGGIDGGLTYGPGGVLFYTIYSSNFLGELKPGSTTPDKIVPLNSFITTGSVGSIAFVPPGFPGAGRVKILSYSGSAWFDVQLAADANGTFDVVSAQPPISLLDANGPEGATFIPAGNPQFTNPSVLVTAFGANKVVSYELDANGDPITTSHRDFIIGLTGAEGAVVDPVTGDFLFSTFGSANHVIAVRGFAAPPTYPPLDPPVIVAGGGVGSSGNVRVFAPGGGTPQRDFVAYPVPVGVRVAIADVTGDGALDIITGTASQAGHVKVFDGKTGSEIRSFLAFGPTYTGGLEIAVGDVNHDNHPDIIVGTATGSSQVKVFSGVDGSELSSFLAFAPGFTGGVNVASGDVDGDGFADIIVGAASGAGTVKVFSGQTGNPIANFFAFDPTFSGGVTVASGDVNGDGKADIIVGSSSNAAGHVKVFSGTDFSVLQEFDAYPGFSGGVRVAAGDVNGDGRADLITTPGAGGGPHVKVFSGRTGGEISPAFFAFSPTDTSGISIAIAGRTRTLAAETTAATGVTVTGAMLTGIVIPATPATVTATFEYGEDDTYGTTGNAVLTPTPGSDAVAATLSLPSGTLTPGTTYHFRIVATNGETTIEGADRVFTTPINHPPSGGTFNIDPLSGTTATTFNAAFADWIDTDGPVTLTYAIYEDAIAVVAQGSDSTPSFSLSVGTHHLRGRIYGDAGEYTQTSTFTVTVTPGGPSYALLYAKTGAVPNAGSDAKIQTGALWSGFGTPAVNDFGQVAFVGKWKAPAIKTPPKLPAQSGVGIFINDDLLVKVGDPVPGISGAIFKSFKDPVIDSVGHIAFMAGIKAATGATAIASTADTVVVTNGRNGQLEVLAREGDIAPGTSSATFKAFSSVCIKHDQLLALTGTAPSAMSDSGIAFTASLNLASGNPAATAGSDTGAWWLPAGGAAVQPIVREGGDGFFATTGDLVKTFSVFKPLAGSPGFGRGLVDGHTAYFFATSVAHSQGLVLANPGTSFTNVLLGDSLHSSALPTAHWAKLALPSMDQSGTNVSMLGSLKTGPGGEPSVSAKGIFQSLNGGVDWEPVVRTGNPAAGFGSGTLFSAFKDPVNSPTCADVAFIGTAKGGSTPPTSANNDGLWFCPDNGPLILVAREGDQPPGAPAGAKWKAFSSLALPGNETGPLFTASLQKGIGGNAGPGGITSASDFGLYSADYSGFVTELVRKGQPLVGKTVKNFTVLKAASGSAGTTRAFNNNHQIVLLVTFSDNSTGIVGIVLGESVSEQ